MTRVIGHGTDFTGYECKYGVVEVGPDWVSVSAGNHELYQWSTRPGHSWPCSDLAELERIRCDFDTNGLCDMYTDPSTDPDDADSHDLACNELNAWTSDVIGEALPEDHPCWFVTVGQFRNGLPQ